MNKFLLFCALAIGVMGVQAEKLLVTFLGGRSDRPYDVVQLTFDDHVSCEFSYEEMCALGRNKISDMYPFAVSFGGKVYVPNLRVLSGLNCQTCGLISRMLREGRDTSTREFTREHLDEFVRRVAFERNMTPLAVALDLALVLNNALESCVGNQLMALALTQEYMRMSVPSDLALMQQFQQGRFGKRPIDTAYGRMLTPLLFIEKKYRAHTNRITALAYSPDGEHIASCAWDSAVYVSNAKTGVLEHMLYGHIRYVNCVVYSPNGRYIASGSDDGSVRIWNAITGALEHVFIDKTDQVFSVEYSADGNHIIVCRGLLHSRTVIINAVTGAVECMFPDAKLAACSPDGKHMVIVHSDNVSHRCPVRIWNIERAVFEATLFNTNTRHINAMVYSPDGVHVAFGIDSAVQIWNVETGLRDHVLIGHTNDVIALAYSPDGQHLISCGGHTICIWNTQTGELENLLPERFNGASCAAYSPDGSAVATGDFNGVLYLWGVGADLRKLGATASKLHVLACHARVPCEGQEQASVIARKVIDSYAETLNAMIMQEVDWRAVQQFYLEYQKELSDDVLLRDSVSAYIQERCTGASSSGSYSSSHDSK